jgi:hypothetical protein
VDTIFLDLKRVLFGDMYFDKYCSMESEYSNLKFQVKILELQLSTLKKNELMNTSKDEKFLKLKNEIAELLREQLVVSNRLKRVFEILKQL